MGVFGSLSFVLFLDRITCNLDWPEICCMVEDDLELLILYFYSPSVGATGVCSHIKMDLSMEPKEFAH